MDLSKIRWAAIAVIIPLCAASCASTSPDADPMAVTEQALNGGQLETGYPDVGMVESGPSGCTGTLIAESVVLTAKHCIDGTVSQTRFRTGTNEGNFLNHTVASIALHPTADLAILKLEAPIANINPRVINPGFGPPAGSECFAVGFGLHEYPGGTVDAGVKFLGVMRAVNEEGPDGTFRSRPVNALTQDGDSGGPFICDGRVAGVLMGGISFGGLKGFSTWAFIDVQWILSQAMDVSSDPPFAAVSWGEGRIDLFGKGLNGELRHKALANGTWSPANGVWEDLGGILVGTPEAVSRAPNMIDIFVRGTTRHVHYKSWNGVQWLPSKLGYWDMGGNVAGHVSAVWRGTNKLNLFAIRDGGGVVQKSWTAGVDWSPPLSANWEFFLAGPWTNVTAVKTNTDRIDVFALGMGTMVHKWLIGTTWFPGPGVGQWEPVGTGVKGNISATSRMPDQADLFVKTTDDMVAHKAFLGAQWFPATGWELHAGPINATPVLTSWNTNRVDAYIQGTNGVLQTQSWQQSTSWQPSMTTWSPISASLTGSPVVTQDSTGSNVFYMALSGRTVRHNAIIGHSTPTSWQWAVDLGGPLTY